MTYVLRRLKDLYDSYHDGYVTRDPDHPFRARHSGTCIACGSEIRMNDPCYFIVGQYHFKKVDSDERDPYGHEQCLPPNGVLVVAQRELPKLLSWEDQLNWFQTR